MSLFHDILSQIQQKITEGSAVNETIARIISDRIHTTVATEQVTVKKNKVYLTVAPTIKMKIRLQQQSLLQALHEAHINVSAIE